jgi:hypothetical protein
MASALMGIVVATQVGTVYAMRFMPRAWLLPRAGGWGGFLGRWVAYLDNLSIRERLGETMQTGFRGSILGDQAMTSFVAAGILFLAAWLAFHWLADLSPESPVVGTLIWRIRKRRRVWRDAFAWKEFQCIAGGALGCLLRLALFVAALGAASWALGQFKGAGTAPRWGEWAVVVLTACVAFDLCLWATRLFSDDWRMVVLPVLVLTPHTPSSICLGKLRGCLIGILPGLVFLLWVSWQYDDHVTLVRWLEHPWAFSVFGGFVLFLHAIAYLSLKVVWGALPLAIALVFVGNTCVVYPILSLGVTLSQIIWGLTDMASALMVLNIALVGAAIGLQMGIVRQLERSAAQ